MKRLFAAVVLTLAVSASLHAEEIGYIEDFSLAKDRAEALKQLIPGTEDYYYYNCLHFQNNQQFDKVDEMLAAWIKRHNYTQRVNEIRYRQALLTYKQNPAESLEFMRKELGIHFNHQRETLGFQQNLPTQLDQKLISRETLKKRALARYKNLNGFEDRALDWLIDEPLNPDQRRDLIQRLNRPDYAKLPKLIIDDLNHQYSRGFGSAGVHRNLLKSQLDELLKLKPDLLNQTNFVNTYLTKLRPSNDEVDWKRDNQQYEAYLNRLWAFVERLAPVHNSLKAHVLYQRLTFDRSRGVYDKDRFMNYIQLPRHVSYIDSDFMKRETSRKYPANLNANFRSQTLLPPVGNDEPLVRSFLHHFFVKETTTKPYEPYINDIYLKHNFAETKIVNGLGEPEQWYSMLPPAKYQELKERVDIDFAYTNDKYFGPEEPVSLELNVKNVKSLIVNVYEINTTNYYRETLSPITTDISLDGLVANHESTHQYAEPPLRRVARRFEFPQLKKRGVFVVDFIGNGKSSRALIVKGRLRHLVRTGTAGQVFTILDEQNRKLNDATLLLGGQQYESDENGEITVPFSNQPGRQPIVITHDEFSSLDHFQHQSENYSLTAGIYVDRQSLLKQKTAQVLIRPGLYLNDTPVTLKVLEDVKLLVTSTDLDGVSTTKEVSDFKLHEDRESTFEFQVPRRLASIRFQLKAKVEVLSQNKKVDLSAAQTFSLNEIDRGEKITDLHFARVQGSYVIDVLGKTGEKLPDRPVRLSIKHRDFRNTIDVSLQSDKQGRLHLGRLAEIDWVKATAPNDVSHQWTLLDDKRTYPQSVHGRVGEVVRVPYLGSAEKPERSELSLLEIRGGTFFSDQFEAVSIEDGFVNIAGLTPGDYQLVLKDSNTQIQVRVTKGEDDFNYILGQQRQLEVRNPQPLQMLQPHVNDEVVTVQLRNASEFTRVHVFATRYRPAYSVFENLARVTDSEPSVITVGDPQSFYIAGRKIGDEYRYILERKQAKKFPGNMLERPSLLLNPWAIRKTETGQQKAQAGDDYASTGEKGGSASSRDARQQARAGASADFSNLDFLSATSAVILNVAPNDQGVVEIERDLFEDNQQLHFVAIDPLNTVYRTTALPQPATDTLDLRLANALDPEQHFTQQKQISVVKAKDKFVLADISTSRFEAYDNLARVYTLYATLSNDPKLLEFSFILNWPNLEEAEKRRLYSKYACHELSFFLFKKDPQFFAEVIKPYLKNKKDKTFLDRWLLGDDLQSSLRPWNHQQLNIVERTLLAQRIEGERAATARHVKDLFDLIPPDVDRFNFLFDTAIKGSALETGDSLGLKDAQQVVGRKLAERLDRLHELNANSDRAMPEGEMQLNGIAGAAESADRGRTAAAARPAPAKPQSAAPAPKNKKADAEYRRRGLSNRREAEERDGFFQDEAAKRERVRQLYRKLDKTQEWVENNYYKLPITQQNYNLVPVNSFWNEYAQHQSDEPFYSVNFADASRNFTEMMFALSVLDLPFKADEHESEFEEMQMTLTAGSPMIVLHEEIKPAKDEVKNTQILVSQNFFRHGDRYTYVNNERLDKYVRDEFLMHVVYGCQVVVTNPTSSPQKLNVLLQVPEGALPVNNGKYTRNVHINLPAYNTQTVEYYFYFPAPGDYRHYPVHVAKQETLMAFAEPFTFNVVKEPSKIDRTSWDYISQHGSREDVLAYLKNNNLNRTNLDKIAFRVADKNFFETVIELLTARHVYNHTLWSYGIKHDVVPAVRQYLQHTGGFVAKCGDYLDSPLLTIDPVIRKTYEHMDYKPLVNARTHQLGRRRQILNDRFHAQYHRLMKILSYRRELNDEALMAVTYYMLLQDRVEEALDFFGRVNAENLHTRLQYDYFDAYIALYLEDVNKAREIAAAYTNHPVDRWRNTFAAVISQLDEIQGAAAEAIDDESREQKQTELAASQPSFDFTVEAKKVRLNYQNIDSLTVNYYLMDIELLFSRNPFVQQYGGQFSYIIPNLTNTVELPDDKSRFEFDLPKQLHSSNVLVEISAAGVTKSQAYYANSLALQLTENYGQVRVAHEETGKPIPKTYVKVYARMQDGNVRFYKDGYTDLRGRFDYTSLNTNELDFVSKFSLLILSDQHGAVVREAHPPKR